MFETFISSLAIILSVCTSTGVLLHDTKVDKVASLALLPTPTTNQPAHEEVSGKLESTAHIHVERTSLHRITNVDPVSSPSVAPRKDDKKFRYQKRATNSDSYALPLVLADSAQLGL